VKEDIIIVLIIKKISDIYLFNGKDKSPRLINYDLLLKLNKDKLRSYNDN